MATNTAANYTIDITADEITKMDENQNCSAAPDLKSSCEHGKQMLFGFGKCSTMPAETVESAADCSGTNRDGVQVISFDKLTQLLTNAGLVCGTIPTWTQKKSKAPTLDAVIKWQDGIGAEQQKAD